VSDGITEGITHRLSQLPSLDKVISSSSVRGYKGKEVDAQTVARELDVRAVVIASMVQSGENIRLSVKLVDGKDNNILWGNNYIRPRSSLYEMEEYLSMEIADAMGIQLTGEEGERLTRRYTEDSEAHDAYLKGQAGYAKGTSDGYLGAISYFEKAIEQDSDYAPAYVALGRAYYVAARGAGAISNQEAMPRAAAAAEQAVELDNTLGLAHAVLGDVQRSFHWDFLEAEKEYQLAIELDPNDARAYEGYASLMAVLGRHDQSITLAKRAQQVDPRSASPRYTLGRLLMGARQYEEAEQQLLASLDITPNYQQAYGVLSSKYEMTGEYEKAASARQRKWVLAGATEEGVVGIQDALEDALATSGVEGYWQWILDYLINEDENAQLGEIAEVYGHLGDKDQAFEILEKAYQERSGIMIYLNAYPWFDPLRDDPRFQDLLRRMNLEP
jgi:TolB-like protein/Flp pilus assembly protein TadD